MARRKSGAALAGAPEPGSPVALAPVAAEPAHASPAVAARLGNADRVARQRDVFANAPVPAPAAPPQPPATPEPAAPTRARRLPPRRVSAEVVRAETRLLDLDRRRQESLEHHERTWAGKRATLIQSFPADVLAALVAMRVLDEVNLQTNGAAAPARDADEAVSPPPTATAPAAAPAEPTVDPERLAQMLWEAADDWGGVEAAPIIAAWTEEQRRQAHVWAEAVLDDGLMSIQVHRPPHTVLEPRGGNR